MCAVPGLISRGQELAEIPYYSGLVSRVEESRPNELPVAHAAIEFVTGNTPPSPLGWNWRESVVVEGAALRPDTSVHKAYDDIFASV